MKQNINKFNCYGIQIVDLYHIITLYKRVFYTKMGNLLKSNKTSKLTKKTYGSTKKVTHKARVLTPADVRANRSMAYTYLNL